MQLTKRLPVLFAFVLLLAACGGAATPTALTPTATALTPTTTDTTPIATEPGGGGGGGGDNACLNTVEEVSAAFGVTVTEAVNTTNPGIPGASCIYFTDKAAFEFAFGITLKPGGIAQSIFDSVAADPSSVAVSGIGDAAFWSGGGLYVRKGDTVLVLSPSSVPTADAEAAVRATIEGLARSAVNQL